MRYPAPSSQVVTGSHERAGQVRQGSRQREVTPSPEMLQLMEAVVERENMKTAWLRVKGNKGAAGVDGMTVDVLLPYLREHWSSLKEDLLAGRYQPRPVRKVEIPKPGGGMRQLGIPTVLDRLIQQALHQVLQPIFDPTFSASSYGFRPGRGAQQARSQRRAGLAFCHQRPGAMVERRGFSYE